MIEPAWVQINDHPDCEIWNQYPFPIRRNERLLTITLNNQNGYNMCNRCYHHRIIAQQFIPNPNNLPEIDHIDRNRQNNHLENLRWVSRRENCKNRTTSTSGRVIYEYINDLPEDAVVVEEYQQHRFEDLYYSHSLRKFIYNNGVNFRLLHNNLSPNANCYYVNVVDTNNTKTSIYLNKYQRLNGFI
jgi:hypothetical protein